MSALRPETLDRLVTVVDAALLALRSLADQARAGATTPEPAPNPGNPVEDIPVVDEDVSAGGRGAEPR